MKILVPVKQVIDPSFPVRLKPDCSGLEMGLMHLVINPYDEVALEEALQWRERDDAQSVLAVSCGNEGCLDVLRSALAMGADRALLIETHHAMSSLVLARILKKIALDEQCDVIFIGRQGMGSDSNQVAPMLAALLDWPLISFAEAIKLEGSADGKTVVVQTRSDSGSVTLKAPLPAVISVELTLNTPRYAAMQNLIKAKKTVIPRKAAESLGVDLNTHISVAQLRHLPMRPNGEIVADVPTLLDRLRHKEKILL